MRWKSQVRYFLAWSSIPPCLVLYRWLYRVAIWIAVQAFRRCPGIVAVYLCRGGAKKEITPGVSDIDFILIVGPDAAERKQVERVFSRLQTLSFGLIPYHHTFVLDEPELHFLWRTTPFRRYLFEEGKSTWLLLHGRDVRSSLPQMTELERTASCFAYMNYWWAEFADFLLQNENCRRDPILRRSVCFKAVADVANALHALRTGEFCYSRSEALEREDTPLCRRLQAASASRIPSRDPAIEEEVYRCLLKAFLDLWDTFRRRPSCWSMAGLLKPLSPRPRRPKRRWRNRHLSKSAAIWPRSGGRNAWLRISSGAPSIRSTAAC